MRHRPPHFNQLDESRAEELRQQDRQKWREARRCQNCYGFYYPTKRKQKFCTEKCRDAAKWQRRRERLKRNAELGKRFLGKSALT